MTEAAQRKPVAKPPAACRSAPRCCGPGWPWGRSWRSLALTHGVMLPGFGGFVDAMLTFVLFLAAGVVLAELTRRHHRTAPATAGGTASAAAAPPSGTAGGGYRGAAVRSRPWRTRIVTAVQTRWAARGAPAAPEPEDPAGGNERICPGCGWAIPADGTCPTCKASREAGQPDPGTGPTYSWGPADGPSGWPADDPETAHRWAQHMSTGGKP